jgi:hypothetical protein
MEPHARNIGFLVASALLLHAHVAWGCTQLIADGHDQFVLKVRRLVELFTEERLNSQALSDVLGGTAVKSPSGKSWSVSAEGYTTHVSISERSKGNSPGLKIYPDSGMGLRLRHVAAVFGEWKTVRTSKTSSVRFNSGVRSEGKSAVIYIEMASPPTDPESSVLSITVRQTE